MSYGGWDRPWSTAPQDARHFTEKGWKRSSLPEWDARWATLSVAARRAFLTTAKSPPKSGDLGYTPAGEPGVPASKFEPEVLRELTKAGFLRVEKAKERGSNTKTRKTSASEKPDRVVTPEAAGDFRTRVRAIERVGLLDTKAPGDLMSFLNAASYPSRLMTFVAAVLVKAGVTGSLGAEDAVKFVRSARWPALVLKALDDPLAERVLGVVRGSTDPLPIGAVAGRIKGADAAKVRGAIDALVAHLALVEDLDEEDLGVVVGILPAVREVEAKQAARAGPPPPTVCKAPRDVGPETGPFVDDLRSVLLEIAGEPPRVRQDGAIFSKEVDRFLAALDPLPRGRTTDPVDRVNDALTEADRMSWVKRRADGRELRLRLTAKGQAWLSADAGAQYQALFDEYRKPPAKERPDLDLDAIGVSSVSWRPYYAHFVLNDRHFLGSAVAVVVHPAPAAGKPGKKATGRVTARAPGTITPKQDDLLALRAAVGGALMEELPEGVYHRLSSVVDRLTFRDRNVILRGQPVERVTVFVQGNPVPALEEEYEEVGRQALAALVDRRLIPLGCLRTATDGEGNLCVARTPRLAAYFGLGPLGEESGPKAGGETRVVVQPDFSVVVIGASTAVLAELAPFCERTGSSSRGPGAAVLKVTKESVTRAVAGGLKARQIVERLEAHASPAPPANVLREVREWADRVKPVKAERRTLVRCPDRETADRVVGLLKERPERLNDTVLLLASERFTPAERKKLRDNGVLVEFASAGTAEASGPRSQRRRTWPY